MGRIQAFLVCLRLLALMFVDASLSATPPAEAGQYDIVVYGGTSAGVVAAVQATRMGKSAVIVCPDRVLGGLSSGGLGFSDTGNKAVIGGLPREFYHRIWQHYQKPEAWKWQRLVFQSTRQGAEGDLFWGRADGAGQVDLLKTLGGMQEPYSFSRDGERLVFGQWDDKRGGVNGIGMLSLGPEPVAKLVLQEPSEAIRPALSPDGRWIAYVSDETGRREVYVRPFPKVEEGKWQISSDGGVSPLWAPDGGELFFRSGDDMMVARIETEPTFKAGTPELLFEGRYSVAFGRNYDIDPEGERFLMLKDVQGQAPTRSQLTVVLHWFEELKRLVPTGG